MSCLHRGPFIQRGRGLGSTLSALFKGVVPAMQVMGQKLLASPITQNFLKTAKRSALEAGLNVTSDALRGKKLKESISENLTTAKKAVTDSLVSALDKAKVSSVGSSQVGRVVALPKKKKRGVKFTSTPLVRKSGKKKQYKDLFEEKF